jgi:hypothetical protein
MQNIGIYMVHVLCSSVKEIASRNFGEPEQNSVKKG